AFEPGAGQVADTGATIKRLPVEQLPGLFTAARKATWVAAGGPVAGGVGDWARRCRGPAAVCGGDGGAPRPGRARGMEIGAEGLVSGRSRVEGAVAGTDGNRVGPASRRPRKTGNRCPKGRTDRGERVAQTALDRAGLEGATKNRCHESEAGVAAAPGNGDDVGLDCAAAAHGLPGHAGELLEGGDI